MPEHPEPEAVPVEAEPVTSTEAPKEPDVLEYWRVRGANRYSGHVCKGGKMSKQFVEFRKGGRLSRDGKFVTVVGPWPYNETTYRLGRPYDPSAKPDPFF